MSTTTQRLTTGADLTHEDARDWYGSYGWHLTTEDAGDVTLQSVEYDWLDDRTGEVAAEKLAAEDPKLSSDEINEIVERALAVREAAEGVESQLEAAVKAYGSRDMAGVIEALDAAKSIESDHGDCPASESLRNAMLEDVEPAYVVMRAPDGCDPSYIGQSDTLDGAREIAAQYERGERGSLEKSLWATAQAAGHCGGITAPPELSDDEPIEWLGSDGYICIVRAAE